MSSLRDLLDKQKGKAPNVKPILQPETKQEVKAAEKEASGAEGTVYGANGTAQAVADHRAGKIVDGDTHTMVEQKLEPPSGLSPIALMKWKRENPGYAQSTTTKIHTEHVRKTVPLAVVGQANNKPETAQGNINNKIASNDAIGNKDAEKTNDGTIDVAQLRKNLEYLANNIEQKELVGQIVRTIAVQIKNNPALMGHMAHADMDLIVRGLRRSYAIVARKKSEKRDEKESKSAVHNELAQAFNDAGLGGFKLDLKL